MMRRPRVKICGITRASDAALAVSLGADALGFILWSGSPRAVPPTDVAQLHRAVPPLITRVGVFVNATPGEVSDVVRVAGIDVVQLHGDEPVADYGSVGARVLKVATLDNDGDVERVAGWPADIMPLVDASDPIRRGGTGKVADWSQAARLSRLRPIVLAGGLTAANIGEALGAVRPWGIDVSSGVEEAPGIKSPTRLREFFATLADVTQREDV